MILFCDDVSEFASDAAVLNRASVISGDSPASTKYRSSILPWFLEAIKKYGITGDAEAQHVLFGLDCNILASLVLLKIKAECTSDIVCLDLVPVWPSVLFGMALFGSRLSSYLHRFGRSSMTAGAQKLSSAFRGVLDSP